MRLLYAAASDVGLVRKQNEDSFVVGGGIFAVCDGMGGARAGEVASELACAALVELNASRTGQEELEEAVQRANTTVWRRGHEDPSLAGMGTTMTVAIRRDDSLLVGHVGDSRAYRWRAGRLDQLTDDHSLVGELVRQGQLTPEQAESHPHRSIITRALGTESVVEPDTFVVGLEPGDRVLLCSDGLSGMVPGPEIAEKLAASDDPQVIADSLVAAALAHGGEDNVTVVVLVAADDGAGDAEEPPGAVVDIDDVLADRPLVGPLDRGPEQAAGAGGALSLRRLRPRGGREAFPRGVDAGGAASVAGRRPRAIVVGAGVAVLVLAVTIIALAIVNANVYFVGASDDGTVALFRGMPISPLGLEMSSVIEPTSVTVQSLTPSLRQRVLAEDLVSKEEGLLFIRSLDETATSATPTTVSTPGSPSTTVGPSATSTTTTTPGSVAPPTTQRSTPTRSTVPRSTATSTVTVPPMTTPTMTAPTVTTLPVTPSVPTQSAG